MRARGREALSSSVEDVTLLFAMLVFRQRIAVPLTLDGQPDSPFHNPLPRQLRPQNLARPQVFGWAVQTMIRLGDYA